MDQKALKVYQKDPLKAKEMLTQFSTNVATNVVDRWWELAWRLVAKYSDGYVNEPGKMTQEVGYPKEWYKNSNYSDGPTSYKEEKKR